MLGRWATRSRRIAQDFKLHFEHAALLPLLPPSPHSIYQTNFVVFRFCNYLEACILHNLYIITKKCDIIIGWWNPHGSPRVAFGLIAQPIPGPSWVWVQNPAGLPRPVIVANPTYVVSCCTFVETSRITDVCMYLRFTCI